MHFSATALFTFNQNNDLIKSISFAIIAVRSSQNIGIDHSGSGTTYLSSIVLSSLIFVHPLYTVIHNLSTIKIHTTLRATTVISSLEVFSLLSLAREAICAERDCISLLLQARSSSFIHEQS